MISTARTSELIRKDVEHIIKPFAQVGQASTLIWEAANGVKLWDTDGKEYTDVSAGAMQCMTLGYAQKELTDAAYEQMKKTGFTSMGTPYSNIPAIEYAKELADVLPGDINHIYFTNTGSESNEVAIQVARAYWEARGENKHKIICLSNAYHGGTALTRSLSRPGIMAGFGREYPGIVRIPNYHCYRCAFGLKYPSCNMTCAHFLEQVIEHEGEETIACMIAEPVQGAAGLVWPQDEWWPIVRKICSDHNILLIDDEVMAGFCRTGKMFAIENWSIVPDIITMGKGINNTYLPLGAVGVSGKIYEELKGREFMAISTSDGNPVCIATGRATLNIYKEQKLADKAAKLGEHIHERLVKEFLPLPCVDDVMGKGLFQSFEIALNKTTGSKFNLDAVTKARDNVFTQCLEKGIVTNRQDGYPRRFPIAPTLTITEDEFDRALDIMLRLMKEVKPV